MEKKKTAGEMIAEFYEKKQEPITPYEFVNNASMQNYETNLEMCIDWYKKIYPSDFYIEKRLQHEWPLGGVVQPFMKGRITCPTPRPLQTAIKYHRKDEAIEYLWTLPSSGQMQIYKRKRHATLKPEEIKTLKWILDYEDGKLLYLARKLNGEVESTQTKFIV